MTRDDTGNACRASFEARLNELTHRCDSEIQKVQLVFALLHGSVAHEHETHLRNLLKAVQLSTMQLLSVFGYPCFDGDRVPTIHQELLLHDPESPLAASLREFTDVLTESVMLINELLEQPDCLAISPELREFYCRLPPIATNESGEYLVTPLVRESDEYRRMVKRISTIPPSDRNAVLEDIYKELLAG